MSTTPRTTTLDTTATFSTDVAGLDDATRPTVVELDDGDTFDLRIAPVAKHARRRPRPHARPTTARSPGPTLRVRQGSEITVHVRNDGDIEATVHWHGLRLDNAYDGVPFETQATDRRSAASSPTGCGSPTPACTGTTPTSARTTASTWACTATSSSTPPTTTTGRRSTASIVVTLDDVLVEDGQHRRRSTRPVPTHVAMGRFGNVMLTGGETNLDARRPTPARSCASTSPTPPTPACSTSRCPARRMKLVGGDSGRYEHETFVDEVLLAPSERAIVDVLFDVAGVFDARAPNARPHLRPRHRRRSATPHATRPSSTAVRDAAHERRS